MRLPRFLQRLRRARHPGDDAGLTVEGRHAPDIHDTAAGDPVTTVLRGTDAWFNDRVADLEENAREIARTHAAVGQPRHDLPRDAPLEMETILEHQGAEVLRNWADRVRVRITGAVESELESLGNALSALRERISDAAIAGTVLDRNERQLQARLAASADTRRAEGVDTIEIDRHLPRWLAGIFLLLLVLGDFFANLPVFIELLPSNSVVQSAFSDWEARELSQGLLPDFGLRHLMWSVMAHPEPAILALSIVVFFLLLGHKLGDSMRKISALWSHGGRNGSPAIRGHLRQAVIPALFCTTGIVLTLLFLYAARERVEPLAQERYVAAEQKLTESNAEIAELEAAGPAIASSVFERRAAAEADVQLRRDRLDYASTISAINQPILYLNLVLVLAAVLLGYLGASGRFEGMRGRLEEEENERLSRSVDELRAAYARGRRSAYEAQARASAGLTRIEHLLHIPVLQDLEAKKARIRCAIPIFRAENARARGLDASDILAFRREATMELPGAEELRLTSFPIRIYDEYIDELRELREKLARMEDREEDALDVFRRSSFVDSGAASSPFRHANGRAREPGLVGAVTNNE